MNFFQSDEIQIVVSALAIALPALASAYLRSKAKQWRNGALDAPLSGQNSLSQHSELVERIANLTSDVHDLWSKYNNLNDRVTRNQTIIELIEHGKLRIEFREDKD